MAGKKDKSQVPSFALTDEHKAWFKEYSKILRMEKLLTDGIKVELPKMQRLRLMFEEVQGKKQEMMKMAPPKPTNEIEGQMPKVVTPGVNPALEEGGR